MMIGFFNQEIVRFLAVGSLNTAFSYGAYAFFIFLSLQFYLATLLQIICSTIFNYFSFGSLVFKNRGIAALPRFILVSLILYLVYTCGIAALRSSTLNDYAAGAVMIMPVALLSFFLNKYFAFAGRNGRRRISSRE